MKTVLITGANRGIGFAFVQQLLDKGFRVIATYRSAKDSEELITLSEQDDNLMLHELDVTNDESISTLVTNLGDTPIDWLINNAGISGEQGVTLGNVDRDNFLKVFEVNALSPVKITEALLPLVAQSQDKLVVCISSRMGSISDNQRGKSYAYRTSKAALNCVMRSLAIDVADEGIHVLLLHPGWVKTRMGGEEGELEPEESVRRLIDIIEYHKDSGHADLLLSHDGSKIPW